MNYSELSFEEELGTQNTDNIWKPDTAGETVYGKLIEKTPNVGKYNQLKIVLENEMGEQLTIFCQTVLARKLRDAEIGDILKIEYVGFIPEKNYNMYNVFRASN